MKIFIFVILGLLASDWWSRLCVAAGLSIQTANAAGWAVHLIGGLAAAVCACALFDVICDRLNKGKS